MKSEFIYASEESELLLLNILIRGLLFNFLIFIFIFFSKKLKLMIVKIFSTLSFYVVLACGICFVIGS